MALGKRWWWRPLEPVGGALLSKWKWASTFRSGKGLSSNSSENSSSSMTTDPKRPFFMRWEILGVRLLVLYDVDDDGELCARHES
ncbi:hypothetical protein PanWU01x14_281160 [Parasponia andersonii]|uniref:Uncharacterized protein n=1 Tax=Parasponia andersonii TaxID=3476 RepID=A0A2P5B1C3_PARAD|nr:hypothetical protein PanWU01x14_281160 [Parasponia andersonii]